MPHSNRSAVPSSGWQQQDGGSETCTRWAGEQSRISTAITTGSDFISPLETWAIVCLYCFVWFSLKVTEIGSFTTHSLPTPFPPIRQCKIILSEDRYSEYNTNGHPEYHTLHILTNPERGEDVSFIMKQFPAEGWRQFSVLYRYFGFRRKGFDGIYEGRPWLSFLF